VTRHGLRTWGDLFTPRQKLCLLSFASMVYRAGKEMFKVDPCAESAKAVATCLSFLVDTLADYSSTICHWKSTTQQLVQTYSRQALPMVWDYPEPNPFGGASGDAAEILRKIHAVLARHEVTSQ
jgi:putative DNA methylase